MTGIDDALRSMNNINNRTHLIKHIYDTTILDWELDDHSIRFTIDGGSLVDAYIHPKAFTGITTATSQRKRNRDISLYLTNVLRMAFREFWDVYQERLESALDERELN